MTAPRPLVPTDFKALSRTRTPQWKSFARPRQSILTTLERPLLYHSARITAIILPGGSFPGARKGIEHLTKMTEDCLGKRVNLIQYVKYYMDLCEQHKNNEVDLPRGEKDILAACAVAREASNNYESVALRLPIVPGWHSCREQLCQLSSLLAGLYDKFFKVADNMIKLCDDAKLSLIRVRDLMSVLIGQPKRLS
ncbi:hypothetical protein NW762_012268 [Fusarium torreyae]|uniref:Uncharacterized protein n=1 Tax=Fusarium torreyae TaxID=1237075 RepID=A0A9W8RRY0_9HYPO|nr:hypothetical protein NW762_012268 [Fusarium torreyae]